MSKISFYWYVNMTTAAENIIKYIQKINNLPKGDHDYITKTIWIAQALIEAMKEDGFDIPLEVAAAIAIFDHREFKNFSKHLASIIFDGMSFHINTGDPVPWIWISKQDIAIRKSLLCWLIKNWE